MGLPENYGINCFDRRLVMAKLRSVCAGPWAIVW